ncbi:PKD domain-containing protein [Streptomyces sp. NPDC059193]|uniref:PKD domain-containing protein n=1 Tax=Streptomyces sp. NPDC059193 TaxID=3346763 RepID=UPI0036CB604D
MRPTRATTLLTAGLVTLLGVPAGAAAAAETPVSLYVNNQDGSNCSDAGAGTQAVPYCTVSAAAKAVAPGQTVRIKPGKAYTEAVTITRSGEPGKPISFVSDVQGDQTPALLSSGKGPVVISGASHVVLRNLHFGTGIRINGSHGVEVDRVQTRRTPAAASVRIGEGSTDVRLTRSLFAGVRIDGGARNTVLGRNEISGATVPAVAAVDAPGTVVTNNTVYGSCAASLSVTGGTTGAALFNNVIWTAGGAAECTAAADPRNAVLVSQSATQGIRADYNLVVGNKNTADPVPYSWSGTTYKDLASFRAATGQGAHDILTPTSDDVHLGEGSPVIDSADATAPGVPPTDFEGLPALDDPHTPNSGKNGGYLDRGAYEVHDEMTATWMTVDQPWAPVGTEVGFQAVSDSRWPTTMSYRVDFGDGSAPVDTPQGDGLNGAAKHVYGTPGDYVVKVTAVSVSGRTATTQKTVKATPAGPGTATFTAKQVLPPAGDTQEHVPPLTYEFDASASVTTWPVENMEVDFGEGWSSNHGATTVARRTYEKPGEYKVKVKLVDTKGGTATATQTVRVDYAPSGYVAVTPYRLQDTRGWGGGALKGGEPTVVGMPLDLKTGNSTAAGMAAVVLNVTLTDASQDTHLTVSPNREDRPTTSNVNVRKGGTSSNTVTVPVNDIGWVWMRLNSGQAHMIVDLVGYYRPNAGEKFSPVTPARLSDTRTSGGALGSGATRTVKVAGVGGIPADAKAVALNLTGTGATTDTHVIAYPDPANRPTTSNLNPEPGKDKSNQAIVPVGPDGTITLYNNAGSTHLVVDAVGFYGKAGKTLFTPVPAKRLADTRTTGKVAPGATTTVAGLPAGAVGAVLNVTATDTTGPGFLTVHGFGTPRTDASSLNTLPGLTVPNHVTTPVGDGKVSVFNSWGGSNHVIADLLGYFTQG